MPDTGLHSLTLEFLLKVYEMIIVYISQFIIETESPPHLLLQSGIPWRASTLRHISLPFWEQERKVESLAQVLIA
jgi:hypothetical protein